MSKRLYTGFSLYQFLWHFILRLICLFGLIYTLLHYSENPVVISIVAIILLLLICFLGDDQIIVYEHKVSQKTNSLIGIFYKGDEISYNIAEIKKAYLDDRPASSLPESAAALLIRLALPSTRTSSDKTHPIFFNLTNGTTVKFETNLEGGKMEKIVEYVNSLIH